VAARAWGGALFFLLHIAYRNVVRVRVNAWYERFYTTVQVGGAELASGDSDMQSEVWDLLVEFVWIVTPNVLVHPLYRALQGAWTLDWRLVLVKAYLAKWKISSNQPVVEGAAQRVHEDARMFTSGIGGIVSSVLDAIVTLFAFTPVLYDLGGRITLPGHGSGELRPSWLVTLVVLGAGVCTGVTALLARGLVAIEIEVQQVEAALRTLLVHAETSPGWILEQLQETPDAQRREVAPSALDAYILQPFFRTMRRLRATIHRLLSTTLRMNVFLSLFHESATLTPYFLAAPLLFSDPETRITLGTLVQLSNVTDKVLGALSVFADNSESIIAFVSVVRRLREFEASQSTRERLLAPSQPVRRAHACADVEMDTVSHV
jgi:peptide/bleomycin uptake transporter